MGEVATVEAMPDAAAPLRRFLDRSPLVSGREMTLVAGRAEGIAQVGELVAWVRERGGRWWSFREWTDGMRLVEGVDGVRRDADATDDVRFVAGRWFGRRGDLEVWRDGAGFGWRWVGPPGARPPGEVSHDFFAGGGEARLLRRVAGRRALLWDRREPRVATADAETMGLLPMDGRMALRFVTYHDRGMVAAVWYRGIHLLQEGRNGG